MKKIAFILRKFQQKSFHGGGEKLFYNIIKRFCKDSYIIDIYCSESDVENAGFANKIVVINEHYDHNKPKTVEKFYNKAKELIKNENYDFVISENITPPVDITFLQGHTLLNRRQKVKSPLEAFFYNFRRVKKERIKYEKKWSKQGYRKVFVVSENLKQDIIENLGIPEEKISIVYPGVEIPKRLAEKPLRKEVTFGLLAPGFSKKGGFVLLNALNILKQKGFEFRAKIVYPKFHKNLGVKILLKLYNLADNVEFLPFQRDTIAFYNSIDYLVVPSLEDTFNLSAIEAMACSKPCIISKNAGVSEIIREGENGFTFDVSKKGAKNLAEIMMFLINNPDLYTKIAGSAYETAKIYNWDRTYQEFVKELYQLY